MARVNVDLDTVLDIDDGVGKYLSIVFVFGHYILLSFRVVLDISSSTSKCPDYLTKSMHHSERLERNTKQN